MRTWLVGMAGVAGFGAIVLVACGNAVFSGTDGAAGDSGILDASGSSEGSSGDAADPCAQLHPLCDDFDQAVLKSIWEPNAGCASPALDTSASVSPPRSLAASNDAGEYDCAYYTANISAKAQAVHCEADVRLDVPPPQFFGFFKVVTVFDDVTYYEAAIEYKGQMGASGYPILLGDDAIFVDAGTRSQSAAVSLAPNQLEGWLHLTLDVDFGMNLIVATVDGIQATLTPTRKPASVSSEQAMRLRVGFEYQGDGGQGTIRYDNVFCDAN